MTLNPNERFRCGNCHRRHTEDSIVPLELTPDLNQRLDPGSVVPDGECPNCGALVYRDDSPLEQWYRTKAIRMFHDDKTRVDDDARVKLEKNGAFVQVWTWISDLGLTRPPANGGH